ncbi:MAG: CbtA family protein [Aeromicrobium sp.]
MTPSQFLVRGLLAGFIAGLAAFGVAHVVGEPSVNAAIAIEESHADHHAHADDDASDHMPVVSRHNQSTWGLLTGTVGVGVALGGIVALASAFAMGRLGRLTPRQSTALVTGIGFVAVALVPFLKYPANPPAVGNPDTISHRTELYFAMLGIAVLAAIAETVFGALLFKRGNSAYIATVLPIVGYIAVIGVTTVLLPSVHEVGAFPADVLWSFRTASILTNAALWLALGIVLTGLIGHLHARESAAQARRDLAASL